MRPEILYGRFRALIRWALLLDKCIASYTPTHIRASGGWRRALGDRMPLAGVTFEGSEPFSVRGLRVAKNAAVLEAGLGLDLSSRARLEVAYGGVISSTGQSHSGRATFSLAF